LQEMLIENKGEILDAWVDQVLATYPEDGARIFKKEKDQFANPVGYAVKSSLWEVYGLLFESDGSFDGLIPALEQLVKIRAVQEFIPSQAVSMAYKLKGVAKDFYRREKLVDHDGWLDFEEKADTLAYTLFDLYMASREQLHRARLEEYRRGNNLLTEGGCCPSRLLKENNAEKAETLSNIL
ncbi:MAG: RsbRD N-terminal domain-containing protein, partial [Pseudomonadota bacterium]